MNEHERRLHEQRASMLVQEPCVPPGLSGRNSTLGAHPMQEQVVDLDQAYIGFPGRRS